MSARVVAVVCLGLAARVASAEPRYDRHHVPLNLVDRELLLPAGALAVDSTGTLGLGPLGEPATLAPDVVYALGGRLNLALTHDRGLCLAGCAPDGVYDDAGLAASLRVLARAVELVVSGELHLESIARGTLDLRVGVVARWRAGRVAVVVAPRVSIGVTDRTVDLGPIGDAVLNEDMLVIPLEARVAVAARVALRLELGLAETPLLDLADRWGVSFGAGALVGVSHAVDLGARVLLPRLIDQHLDGATLAPAFDLEQRALELQVTARF